MDLAFSGKNKVSMRASRAAIFCVEKHPHLIVPYLNKIIKLLPDDESVNTMANAACWVMVVAA